MASSSESDLLERHLWVKNGHILLGQGSVHKASILARAGTEGDRNLGSHFMVSLQKRTPCMHTIQSKHNMYSNGGKCDQSS